MPAQFQDLFLDLPTTFDASRLPGAIDHWRAFQAVNYLDNPNGNPRAIAANDAGNTMAGWSRANATGPNNGATQDEANRRALEFCEAITYGERPCFLHTVGLDRVWDPANTDWQPVSLRFEPNPVDVNLVPFVTNQDYLNRIRPAYDRLIASAGAEHLLVVMARFGRYPTVIFSPNPIDDNLRNQSLADCDALVARDFPAAPGQFQMRCFVYSEDMQIVMTPDSYGRASHGWHPDNRN